MAIRLRMTMPKTTMDKDHLPPPIKNNIGAPWNIPPVKGVTKAHRVNEATNRQFRRSVLAADQPHPFATFKLA
jgi:hypothetical protein